MPERPAALVISDSEGSSAAVQGIITKDRIADSMIEAVEPFAD
jgi:hypothetical protein